MASVALCVRSYRVCDSVGFGRVGGNSHVAQSIRGHVHLLTDLDGGYTGVFTYRAERIGSRGTWDGGSSGYPDSIDWRMGFVWQKYFRELASLRTSVNHTRSKIVSTVVVPYWFPAAVFTLSPVALLIGTRRRFGLLAAMLLVAAIAVVVAGLRPPRGSYSTADAPLKSAWLAHAFHFSRAY